MVSVAVIGGGYWGKNLIRNFAALGALKVVCDTDLSTRKRYEAQYHVQSVGDVRDLQKMEGINAWVIAAPAVMHSAIARMALTAGKSVFVEKPLALKVDEAEELIHLARENKATLMVGHLLQYHPAVVELKKLIDDGELGRIRYVYSNRLNMGKIRTEENILWSFAPHDISVIVSLLEELPEGISASGGSYLQPDVSDVTLSSFEFPGGVKGHIFVSWLHPFKEQKLVVVGDQKMAVFDDMSKEKLKLYPHSVVWRKQVPEAHKAEPVVVPVSDEEPLKLECQHFLECVENGQTPKTDGEEGLRVLKVLDACQKSLDKGGEKVAILSPGEREREREVAPYFAHPTAYVDKDVVMGSGTRVWHFSHILSGSALGESCRIGQNVVIGPNVKVGNRVKIQNNVCVYDGVTLEDDVFCGPSMVFTNVLNPRSEIPRMHEKRNTLVRKGATLGANCTLICGHTVGRYAFIGAGAVVTKDVPDYALILGNPGKIAGWMCRCGTRLQEQETGKWICPACGKEYELDEKGMKESGVSADTA